MSNTVRVYKDGAVEQIEASSLDKFLAMGWTTKGQPAKKKPKAVLKAKGEVKKPKVEETKVEEPVDDELETLTFSLEDSGPNDDETTYRNNIEEN